MNAQEQRAVTNRLREQWTTLWRTRFDDRFRAEGIASHSYPDLFVDMGQVIVATRDYKPLSFREILEAHFPSFLLDVVDPCSSRGGVRKFIRESISKQNAWRKNNVPSRLKSDKGQQLRRGGRGWLCRRFDL